MGIRNLRLIRLVLEDQVDSRSVWMACLTFEPRNAKIMSEFKFSCLHAISIFGAMTAFVENRFSVPIVGTSS